MKKITILIPKIKPPEQPDIITNQLKNIFSRLEQFCNLNLVWLIFQPDEFEKYQHENYVVIDYHKFKNAVEVIDSIQPDLIINEVRLGMNGIAFGKAGKFRNIPVVTITPTGESEFFSSAYSAKSNLQLVMSDKVLASVNNNKKIKKFGMLRYSLCRYFFLLKTLRKTDYSLIEIIKFILFYPRVQIFSKFYPALNKITSGDLNICFNQHWSKRLIDAGFTELSIFLTGDPAFDPLFEQIQNKNSIIPNSDKLRILFCPTPMHEHGWLTKQQEEELIIKLINQILKNNNFSISLKIHPSSSSYGEYFDLLQSNNINIPLLQKENTIELLDKFDIMLTYGSSNVILDAILIKKPVILFKDYKIKELSRLSDKSVITECDTIEHLNNIIQDSIKNTMQEEKYVTYLTKQIGLFDGKNSERIVKRIIELIENKTI